MTPKNRTSFMSVRAGYVMGSSINNVTILKEGEGESIIEKKLITNSFKNSGDMRDGRMKKVI